MVWGDIFVKIGIKCIFGDKLVLKKKIVLFLIYFFNRIEIYDFFCLNIVFKGVNFKYLYVFNILGKGILIY